MKPGLRILALTILNKVIQEDGAHGPIEDADATMRLHLRKTPYDRETEAKKWKAVWKALQAQQVPQPSGSARSNTNYHSGRGGQAVRGHRGVNLVTNNSGNGSQVMMVNGNVINNYVEVQNFFPPLPATRGGGAAGNMGVRGGNAGRGGPQGRGGFQAAGRGDAQAAGRGGTQGTGAGRSYAQAAGRGGIQGAVRGGLHSAGRGVVVLVAGSTSGSLTESIIFYTALGMMKL
ncbi:hypothetical protein CBER1_06979 [Cercospora berteroae]|uniref:Uncharacterized protein n=1 Tax=Cercospora berteroae TaxID=357750 RepID=A0A2S6BSC9_9PEZI|nr:hypothetical protein CBER1_06979 [Cercospora berteroae]